MDRTLLACSDQICSELTFNSMMEAWILPCWSNYPKISFQHRNYCRRSNMTRTFLRKNQERWGPSFRRATCSTDLKTCSLSLIIPVAATPSTSLVELQKHLRETSNWLCRHRSQKLWQRARMMSSIWVTASSSPTCLILISVRLSASYLRLRFLWRLSARKESWADNSR